MANELTRLLSESDSGSVAIAVLCIAAVLLFWFLPALERGSRATKRRRAVMALSMHSVVNQRATEVAVRRKQIREALEEFEKGKKKKRPSLQKRLAYAGLRLTPAQFLLAATLSGVVGGGLVFLFTHVLLFGGLAAFVIGFGLPIWLLAILQSRRLKKLSAAFPDALDAIVRGVKAGMPVGDSMRMIAGEAPEPLRSEFTAIVEEQAAGMTLRDSVSRFAGRVPTQDVAIFAIVMGIQAESGGNLSEALANLSKLLRERAMLRLKIQALAAEAKASAWVVGALPFVIVGLVYLTSPEFMRPLFTHPIGHLAILGSLVWMGIGLLVMRGMINFKV